MSFGKILLFAFWQTTGFLPWFKRLIPPYQQGIQKLGQETWYLCSSLRLPSFSWPIFTVRNMWPQRWLILDKLEKSMKHSQNPLHTVPSSGHGNGVFGNWFFGSSRDTFCEILAKFRSVSIHLGKPGWMVHFNCIWLPCCERQTLLI